MAKYNFKRITRLIYQKVQYNLNSTRGSNLRVLTDDAIQFQLISKHDNILNVTPKDFKRRVKFYIFPPDEAYRIQLLNELITFRDREMFFNNIDFEDDYVVDMINYLCIN